MMKKKKKTNNFFFFIYVIILLVIKMAIIGIPLKYSKLEDGRCILYLGERLRRTVQKAGGFILPIVQVQDVDYLNTKFDEFKELTEKEKDIIEQYLDKVDGVLFPGGHKITPFDVYLLKRCIDRDIPTLGICLGMQLMSCYNEDFKVYPNETEIEHFQKDDNNLTHIVKILKGTKLYEIFNQEEIEVNSFHNFHVEINNGYKISAISEDNYIEGIELDNQTFHVGIQWHPEISYDFDNNSRLIIDKFIAICNRI